MTDADFGTVAIPRPATRSLARWAIRRALTPAKVDQIGLVLCFVAAVWFSAGSFIAAVTGSCALGLTLLTDAVGAELVRAHGGRTALSAWLTVMLGHAREYTVYAGLAIGGAATHVPAIWLWAGIALIVHALRNAVWVAGSGGGAAGAGTLRTPPPRGGAPATGWQAVPLAWENSPIRAADPSAADPSAGDTAGDGSLVDELLDGETPHGSTGRHAKGERPDASNGRVEHGAGSAAEGGVAEGSGVRSIVPAGWRRRLLFAQQERFLIAAVTVTIWDARVTFIALIVGGCIATLGSSVRRSSVSAVR